MDMDVQLCFEGGGLGGLESFQDLSRHLTWTDCVARLSVRKIYSYFYSVCRTGLVRQ